MTTRHAAYLRVDAANRAFRTLYQQLVVDVVLAVVLVLAPIVNKADGFGDFEWKAMAFLVVKTILSTLFAYLMRRFLDPSGVPTPLPPVDPGEPADYSIRGSITADKFATGGVISNTPLADSGEEIGNFYRPQRAMDDQGNPIPWERP